MKPGIREVDEGLVILEVDESWFTAGVIAFEVK